jgi:hypothetical protein
VRRLHASRLLLVSILGPFLVPELASAQVSASAPVRAEVRERCPRIFRRCRPKPPKPPDDDDDGDDDQEDRRRSRAVQSFLQGAEVVTAEGEVVFPSHVTLGSRSRWWISVDPKLADPGDRSSVLWEWWGNDDEHGLEAAYRWLFAGNPQLPPVLKRTPGVITIVAEY